MTAAGLDTLLSGGAEALAERLRSIDLARERLDAFPFGAEEPAPTGEEGEAAGDAEARRRDLLLRAVARWADPLNHAVLARVREAGGSLSLPELAAAVGLPTGAVTERVHELAQVGLARRALERESVETTALAAALDAVFARLLGAP